MIVFITLYSALAPIIDINDYTIILHNIGNRISDIIIYFGPFLGLNRIIGNSIH